MKKEVGLWIDYREAFVVTLKDSGEETSRIYSNIETDPHFSGRSRSAGSQEAENMKDRKDTAKLGRYYDAIIGYIRDAESICIFGPGEAKGELAKRLNRNKLSQLIVSVETTDKLTDPQIIAKVRQNFPG